MYLIAKQNVIKIIFQQDFLVIIYSLVETAWTFCMYFNVASNFYYDFLKLLRKLSSENTVVILEEAT